MALDAPSSTDAPGQNIDRPDKAAIYLKEQFHHVRGMSSLTAATVCTELLRQQTKRSIHGHIAEIGIFEGRFFIGLALCAAAGERCIAVDTFKWPDDGVFDRFMANCQKAGVNTDSITAEKTPSGELTSGSFRKLTSGPVRFLHIDGAHDYDTVCHDLRLAKSVLHPSAVLCMDDVLHPQYPDLTIAVADFLKSSRNFNLLAVIDRESFPASCKFLICRDQYVDLYKSILMESFPGNVMKQRARYFGMEGLIISPLPK